VFTSHQKLSHQNLEQIIINFVWSQEKKVQAKHLQCFVKHMVQELDSNCFHVDMERKLTILKEVAVQKRIYLI